MEIVRLREATAHALSSVNALLRELSPNSTPLSADSFAATLASDELEVWVAKENEDIIGMATLVMLRELSGISGEVDDVVVLPSAQGKGIGRALMERIIERAKERGMQELDLTSRPSRVAANALYQKLGFEKRETNVYRMKLK